MAGGKERVLRRRIGSVQNTKKITRAMELIAATRVVKAQQRARAARPYAEQITAVIENLAAGGAEVDHPLLRQADKVERVGVIVISSDRGLAGPYNSSVIKAAERQVQNARSEGADYSLIVIGKKASDYFAFRKYAIESFTMGISDNPTYADARRIADEVSAMFSEGRIDRVELVYTEFVSLGSQKVATRRFLPLESSETIAAEGGGDAGVSGAFEFEPSPEAVLESLLPRYVEARLFGALLDSAASEHASRQRAMKAATDNAEELITKLSREMNQARQDAITTEIMEIVGGAEAMGSGNESEEPAPVGAQN